MRMTVQQLLFSVLTATTLSACGGGGSHPASNWIGKTYLLDRPPSTRWVEPKKGSSGSMGDYVPQFFIGVEAGSGDNLSITLTTGLDGVQDMCTPTTEVTVTGANYPDVEITVPSLPIHLTETDPDLAKVVATTIHDVSLKNVLPGRNETTPSGELKATLDFAEAYPMFHLYDNPTKELVCAAFEDAGVPCQTCAFNGEPYCLTFRAVQLVASEISTPIQPLLASDIAPSCP
jgi:hypothetical protein